jgi:hypothetical protein
VAAFVLVLFAFAAGDAAAGGPQVSLVATAGRVWVTTGFDVAEVDASSGRVVRRLRTGFSFPISIGVSDGAVWVSSVDNGFTAGAIDRIPFDSARVTHPLSLPRRPVLALAVGSSTTWALVGPWQSLRLAAIDHATQRTSTEPVRDIGWLAADDTGLTDGLYAVTLKRGLLERIGRPAWVARTARIATPPAVGLGSVWVTTAHKVWRVDPVNGRTLGSAQFHGFPIQLVADGGYVWLLTLTGPGVPAYVLSKLDPHSMRVLGRRSLGRAVGSIAYGNGSMWIARSSPIGVLWLDPRTLTMRVVATKLG